MITSSQNFLEQGTRPLTLRCRSRSHLSAAQPDRTGQCSAGSTIEGWLDRPELPARLTSGSVGSGRTMAPSGEALHLTEGRQPLQLTLPEAPGHYVDPLLPYQGYTPISPKPRSRCNRRRGEPRKGGPAGAPFLMVMRARIQMWITREFLTRPAAFVIISDKGGCGKDRLHQIGLGRRELLADQVALRSVRSPRSRTWWAPRARRSWRRRPF